MSSNGIRSGELLTQLAFSFTILGITSLIGQIMLIRELMIVFYGNEFFIGWILFSWFLWVAIGSLAAGKLARTDDGSTRRLIACHVAVTLLLPASICAARCARLVIGAPPGAIPDLIP